MPKNNAGIESLKRAVEDAREALDDARLHFEVAQSNVRECETDRWKAEKALEEAMGDE